MEMKQMVLQWFEIGGLLLILRPNKIRQ